MARRSERDLFSARFQGKMCALVLAFAHFGCASSSRSLCERAAECDFIGEEDIDECTSDLKDAIDDGDVDKSQVRECLRCTHDNECGGDILVDCASDCEDVGGIVFASNL